MNVLRRFDPQLPREVWLLQLGGVLNSFGNGIILPFLVVTAASRSSSPSCR